MCFPYNDVSKKSLAASHTQKSTCFMTHLSTYTFLNLQTIFVEKHVWCDTILPVVKESHHAVRVHALACVKL